MKFNDGYAFPHPVLGINDDVEGQPRIGISYDENTDPDNYIISIQYHLDNSDLDALIAENKAVFICESNCTSTLYRKADTCPSPTQVIAIPKNAVRNEVKLLCLLIAATPIQNYKNSKAHPDFDGYTFDIDPGDVLAFLGETAFIAGIAYKKLQAVSSFMEIIPGENEEGDFNIILDNAKIQIQLSKKDYQKYSESAISQRPDFASTFHSSIVLSSLIHALYQLTDPSKTDLKDTAWARIIEFRLLNDDRLKGMTLDPDNIIKIAQLLLGMPVERLLADLHNKVTADSED